MNTDNLSTSEKSDLIKKTFYEAAKFFYDKSIDSGRLEKELIRLSVSHIRLSEDVKSSMIMRGYHIVLEELDLTMKTISYLDQNASVLYLVKDTTMMVKNMEQNSSGPFTDWRS